MANQDVDTLARKIVSLERRHAALARAQQLPSSSVRLAEGEDVMLPSAIQNGEDAYSETGIIGERTDSMGDLIDSEVEYGTYIPDWLGDIGVSSDIAWDSTQFATDLSLELEAELGTTNQDLAQAQAELTQAQADLVVALSEAEQALLEAEAAVTAAGSASIVAADASAAATAAQTAAGTAQSAADQAAADALAASNAAGTADSKATAAQAAAAQATADASAASSAAATASTAAANAEAEALAAVGIANNKGKVIYQASAPTGANASENNLWIRTSDNKPHTYNGSTWDAVTDQAALDAAATATAADGKATAAQTAANNAQAAANTAQTTADAKGKVIIQPGAPNAADRLPQNLWIDTTGGNNTPKRWNGNNWVVVTDKAATDAAAAAVTAQDRADDAYDEALSAATAAGNAQASADGKNTVWYQNDQPAGSAHKTGDTWFKTNDGNRVYRWNGSAWVTAQFGSSAISDTAVTAAKLANNAVTAGKILDGAITDDKLDNAVKNSITTAQATATNAQTVASNAQAAASSAQTDASNAQIDADQAIADALAAANAASAADSKATNAASAASTADGKAVAAQNIANAKGKVIIQSAAPAAADRLVQNLWIDTTNGANTPKRWVSGTTWAVVTDKAATDAAAAAVTAQNAASAAQSRADDAHTIASAATTAASAAASAASAAQTAANNAQTTANGKNKVVRSTANASSPGSYAAGDQWWKYSGSQITAMWIHSGSAWVSQTLTDSVITNLNAGSITAGTISAARLSATNIKSVLINAGAIEAANIATGTITAASGIIADLAIGTTKIINGAITSAKIDELAVTNAKIANGTIQHAKIGSVDAAKITVGTLNAARIGANSIDTTKLLIQGANLVPNPTFETLTGWTVGGGLNPTLSTTSRGRAAYFGRSVNGERTLTSQEIYVAGETTYTVGALVLRQAGTPAPALRLEVVPVNSSGVEQTPVVVATHSGTSTTWASIYGQYTVPASTYRSIKFRFVAGATTATSGNDYLVQPRIVQSSVGEMIVDGAIVATKIKAGAVVADKIASNAVTAVKINANAVTAVKIAANAVIADKIASNAVTANKIAANAVTAGKIQAEAIDGMTITGALIRTAPTGQRMELDVSGWHGYGSSNNKVSTLDLADGRITLSSDATMGGVAAVEMGAGKLFDGAAMVQGLDQGDGIFVLSTQMGLPTLGLYSRNEGYSVLDHKSLKMHSNGTAADGPQTDVTLERKRGGQLHEVVLYNPGSAAGSPQWGLQLRLGGTSKSRLYGDDKGQLFMQTYAGSSTTTATRPIAFAEAAGGYTSSLAVNNNTGRTVTFTYPSSRFTIGPVLQCTPTSSARLQVAVTGSTTTTATVRVDNFSGANVANLTWGINWHATQRLVGNASG